MTVEIVQKIFLDERADEEVAVAFGVTTKYVQDIKRGRKWRSVTISLGQVRPPYRGGRAKGTGGKPKRDIRHERLRRNKLLTA